MEDTIQASTPRRKKREAEDETRKMRREIRDKRKTRQEKDETRERQDAEDETRKSRRRRHLDAMWTAEPQWHFAPRLHEKRQLANQKTAFSELW
ncbi:hypothetical protein AAMO2058_001550500 [Amorphochlora amoebiformis]